MRYATPNSTYPRRLTPTITMAQKTSTAAPPKRMLGRALHEGAGGAGPAEGVKYGGDALGSKAESEQAVVEWPRSAPKMGW